MKLQLLTAGLLIAMAGTASAGTITVADFGDHGWYSDDTRSSAGADLVGLAYTHYGKPGQTPTAADDAAIAAQLQFVNGPAGSTYGGAIKIDGTSDNSGKSTISVVDIASGLAPASDLVGASFWAAYKWYMEPNPTTRTVAFRLGIRSTQWAASQAGFTAIRSGESSWDLILVHVMDSPVANAWNEPTVDVNNGLWNLYGQAGNGNWVAIAGSAPPGGTVRQTLAAWNADTTWGPILFGTGATVVNVQFGLGSGQRQCNAYVDYLQTSVYNNGEVVNFTQAIYVATTGNDTTGTGTKSNPYRTIQKGINQAPAFGAVIVAAGTYHETAAGWADLQIFKSLTIQGAGSGQTVVELRNATQNGVEIRGTSGDIDVTLEGITFTKEAAGGPGFAVRVGEATSRTYNLVFRDVEIAWADGRNLFLDGTGNTYASVLIEDCNLHHAGSWCCSMRGTLGDIQIVNSSFDDNGWSDAGHGIGLDLEAPTAMTSLVMQGGSCSRNTSKGVNLCKVSNATFSGVRMNDNTGSPAGGFGVSLWEWAGASSGLVFERCEFKNNSNDGFLFGTEGTCSISDVTIDCCTLTGNGRAGVFCYQYLSGTLSDLHINRCSIVGNGSARVGVWNYNYATTIDAENNWWGDPAGPGPSGPGAGDRVIGPAGYTPDYDPWAVKPVSCGADVVYLEPSATSYYIKPTETCVVDLKVANLQQPVLGLQAMLNFSSTYFKAGSGEVGVGAGGGVWDQLIWSVWETDGDLDVAVGVQLTLSGGTQDDATTATMTLTPTGTEGLTKVVFRSDGALDTEQTMLTDLNYLAIYPVKVDTTHIYIDGTAPLLNIASAKQSGQELLVSLGSAVIAIQGVVDIQVTASDPSSAGRSGLAAGPIVTVTPSGGSAETATFVNESPAGTFNYTWTVTSATPNGVATIDASVSDRAGNTATDSDTFNINKNQVSGQVELEGFAGASRVVTFVATGGSSTRAWNLTLSGWTAGVASYTLTEVPEGTTGISAKAAWNLRQKLGVTLVSGQATADFIVGEKLYGGDVNGSNSVNIQDYAIMKKYWLSTSTIADINGDGAVNATDYALMKLNWYKVGDAQ